MAQIVEENKSLWRIKKMYKKDASGCKQCQTLWDKLEKDKEDHIRELEVIIKTHINK
jgi:hypothetical protein